MPFDRSKYPDNWRDISIRVREAQAWRCGWCPARQGEPHPVTGSRVVLTVAHLNHNPMDCRRSNLIALCQRCHLNYDRPRHLRAAAAKRRSRRASGDLFDPLTPPGPMT